MSKAHNLSASKVDLALHCSYFARPDVLLPERPSGPSAVRGNTVHKASDCYHKGLPMPEFHGDTGALWLTLKGWIDGQAPFTHSEIALLLDVENDTAALCEVGELGERDYLGVTALKIPMRLDLVRWDGVTLDVVDLKTGARKNVSPEAENVQLATMGLAAARYFGAAQVRVGLVFPLKTRVHAPEWHVLDADALDLHAGKLHRLLRGLPTSEPMKGDHCWSCPMGLARGFATPCPAYQTDEADTRFDGAAE